MASKHIHITEAEHHNEAPAADTLRRALLLLHTRGYVVLRNALPASLVADVHRRYFEIHHDCQQSRRDGEQFQTSAREGAAFFVRADRWRIFPRLQPPFDNPRLIANAFVQPALEGLLGADFYCKYVSSDTCGGNAILQSPHRDLTDTDNSRGAAACIVNIPLMECGLHNGPLEVWPCGSHLWRDQFFYRHGWNIAIQDGRNPAIEEFAELFPSEKLVLQRGDILLRDPALWHRGTPNPSGEPRMMLTILCMRRDAVCDYGTPLYNLDRTMFDGLEPRVRRQFAWAFVPPVKKRRWLSRFLTRTALKSRDRS